LVDALKGALKMTRNIGAVDRVIRIVVGLAVLSLVFVGPQTLWGLLGLVPLLTALVGWCPPYAMLGISTCRSSSAARG
jgi:Inner membrane protein YgaP-like, transmembrane domain